jgi:hypothetical protein
MKPILRLPARPADGSVIRAEGRIVRHGMGGSDDPIIDDSECTGAAFNAALPVSALSFAFRANFEIFLFRERSVNLQVISLWIEKINRPP